MILINKLLLTFNIQCSWKWFTATLSLDQCGFYAANFPIVDMDVMAMLTAIQSVVCCRYRVHTLHHIRICLGTKYGQTLWAFSVFVLCWSSHKRCDFNELNKCCFVIANHSWPLTLNNAVDAVSDEFENLTLVEKKALLWWCYNCTSSPSKPPFHKECFPYDIDQLRLSAISEDCGLWYEVIALQMRMFYQCWTLPCTVYMTFILPGLNALSPKVNESGK